MKRFMQKNQADFAGDLNPINLIKTAK